MVNDRAVASGEKWMKLSEEPAWFDHMLSFGDILKRDGPLVEIESRLVFANLIVGDRQWPVGEGLFPA